MAFKDDLVKSFLAMKKGLSSPVPGGRSFRAPEEDELLENDIPGVPLAKAAFGGTGAGNGISAYDTQNDVRGRQNLANSQPSLLGKFAERPDKVEGENPSPESKSMLQMFYERPDKVSGGNPSPDQAAPAPRPRASQGRAVAAQPSAPAREYGYGAELNDEAMKAEMERSGKAKDGHMVFEGLMKAGNALTGTDPDDKFFRRLDDREDEGLKNIQTRRKGLSENNKYAVEDEQSDPGSSVNVGFRDMLGRVAPHLKKLPNFNGVTVATGGPLEKMAEAFLRSQSNAEDKAFNRDLKLRDLQRKEDNFAGKQVETFTGRYEKSGIPRLQAVIDRIEKRSGKPIEQMNEKDLDGFGRGQNILPDWAYMGGKKGVEDRADVAELFNAARHGDFAGNLTQHESAFFEKANPSRSFVPEANTLGSLRRAKDVISSKRRNYESSLSPHARRVAEEQGVPLSGSRTPSTSKPRTVVQNGHTYTLNEETGEYE